MKNRLHMYKVPASSELNCTSNEECRKGVTNVRFRVMTDNNEFNPGIQLWGTHPKQKKIKNNNKIKHQTERTCGNSLETLQNCTKVTQLTTKTETINRCNHKGLLNIYHSDDFKNASNYVTAKTTDIVHARVIFCISYVLYLFPPAPTIYVQVCSCQRWNPFLSMDFFFSTIYSVLENQEGFDCKVVDIVLDSF